MFLELVGTLVAGLAMAGVVMAVNRFSGGRLPSWLVPVAAGLAMIATTISSEYGWYDRTRSTLPESMVIVQAIESRALYRPWTYVAPFVNRFAAVDASSVRRNPQLPDQRLAHLYFFGRWAPVNTFPVLVDCTGMRRANLADGAEFADDGSVGNADWITVPADDPVVGTICGLA